MNNLTERETEIMLLVGKGHTGRQIGLEMGIVPSTVMYYRGEIYKKLDVKNGFEAVATLMMDERFRGKLSRAMLDDL